MSIQELEINDDLLVKFKRDTLLEVYEYDDSDCDYGVEEVFKSGEEIEVTILDINEQGNTLTVQFPDSAVTFLPLEFIEILEINP
jgi:hypothetical protein